MHLKSSNGAIDVLVCPEDDVQSQSLQSPHPATPLTPPSLVSSSSGGVSHTPRPASYGSVLDQPSQSLIQGLVLPDQQGLNPGGHLPHPAHHPQHCHASSGLVHHHQTTSCTTLETGRQEACVDNTGDVAQPNNSAYPQILGPGGNSDLEISLSSAADVDSDFEGLMDHLLPVDMAMFEHLSPPLQNEDFSFSMDNSTEGIQDLFDL